MSSTEFYDPELQRAFDRDGMVVVPLLDPGEVARLRAVFHDLVDPGFGSHYTSASADVAYREAVFESIAGTFAAPLASVLRGLRPVVANFFAKEPAPGTSLVVHQDWSFVDETQLRSLNVWCPLEDATADNGTLRVLRGSHRLLSNVRGTSEGAGGLPSPFEGIEARVTEELLEAVPVTAGWAIINDHRLVHASGDNRSDALRLAASLTLVPAERPVVHAFGGNDGTIDLIELEDLQLRRIQVGRRPAGRLLGTRPFHHLRFDLEGYLAENDHSSAAPSDSSGPGSILSRFGPPWRRSRRG